MPTYYTYFPQTNAIATSVQNTSGAFASVTLFNVSGRGRFRRFLLIVNLGSGDGDSGSNIQPVIQIDGVDYLSTIDPLVNNPEQVGDFVFVMTGSPTPSSSTFVQNGVISLMYNSTSKDLAIFITDSVPFFTSLVIKVNNAAPTQDYVVYSSAFYEAF